MSEISNVAAYLKKAAKETPNQLAIVEPKESRAFSSTKKLTFQELHELCCGFASGLSQKGIAPGMRTLVVVKPGLNLLGLVFALFKIGAVPILIDPGMKRKTLLNCIERSKPEALVGIPLAQGLSRLFPRAFKTVKIRVKVGSSLNKSRKQLVLGDPQAWKEDHQPNVDDLAGILFTSGSTGSPKGVCYQHRHFLAQLHYLKNHFDIQPGEVDFPMLPVFALFTPALGSTMVLPPLNPSKPAKAKISRVVNVMIQQHVTMSFGSPTLWQLIVQYCLDRNITLPNVKKVLMAGAPVPPRLLEDFYKCCPNAEALTPYGATECLPITAINGKEILSETRALSEQGKGNCVGTPLPDIQFKVIEAVNDPIDSFEQANALPNGEVGEIVVHGPIVTESYDQLPEATQQAKIKSLSGLWHRLGDMGYLDDAGRLWFCGRKSHRVITSKRTWYSVCCEAIFNQHPKIFRTALIPSPLREGPALAIELPQKEKVPKSKLLKDLKELAASTEHTKDIQDFYLHPSFPVDVRHNAKIHREEIAEWAKTAKALT
jgi:acyl-CoA synthetase (AMP-forming)/AMP-acid ligase II